MFIDLYWISTLVSPWFVQAENAEDSSKEPKVLSSDAYNGKITKLIFGESEPRESEPDKHEHIEEEKLQASGKLIESLPHDADVPQNVETETTVSSEEPTRTDFDDHIQRDGTSAADMRQYDSIPSVEKASQDLESTEQHENNFYDDKDDFSNTASDQNKNEPVEEKVGENPEAGQV